MRQGASSVPATESVILRMIKETDGESYEEMRSLTQEPTFDAAKKIFNQAGLTFGEPQMRTLGMLREDEVFANLRLLLSDQNPHTIKAAVFEGSTKTMFKDRYEFTGSLLRQLEERAAFIDRYNSTRSRLEGLRRVDERDYPPEAIHEVLLNAIVYRDYTFSGPALVSVFADRMEFVTIGGLVKGITLADLELGVFIARNRALANVFYRLGFIEAYGTVVPKVREYYAGSPLDAVIKASDNAFKITLSTLAEIGGKPAADIPTFDEPVLKKREKEAIAVFQSMPPGRKRDLEEALGDGLSTANGVIKSLEKKGCIEQVGQGRSTRYRMRGEKDTEWSCNRQAGTRIC